MDYHAHIYYTVAQRPQALALQYQLKALSEHTPEVEVYPLVDRCVGPHLQPMFEVAFTRAQYDTWLPLIEQVRGELPVLIHPLTPNQWANHGELARWLGQQLPLDLSKLTPPAEAELQSA